MHVHVRKKYHKGISNCWFVLNVCQEKSELENELSKEADFMAQLIKIDNSDEFRRILRNIIMRTIPQS